MDEEQERFRKHERKAGRLGGATFLDRRNGCGSRSAAPEARPEPAKQDRIKYGVVGTQQGHRK